MTQRPTPWVHCWSAGLWKPHPSSSVIHSTRSSSPRHTPTPLCHTPAVTGIPLTVRALPISWDFHYILGCVFNTSLSQCHAPAPLHKPFSCVVSTEGKVALSPLTPPSLPQCQASPSLYAHVTPVTVMLWRSETQGWQVRTAELGCLRQMQTRPPLDHSSCMMTMRKSFPGDLTAFHIRSSKCYTILSKNSMVRFITATTPHF